MYPSFIQQKYLFQVLAVCQNWYNMCLEDRYAHNEGVDCNDIHVGIKPTPTPKGNN